MTGPEAVGSPKSLKDDRAVVAQRILHAVRDLALEVRPQLGRGLVVTLDNNLDGDLGFDSLGRAELVLRVDRMFQIRLPDVLISEMNTPADLLAAVLAAGPAADFARRIEETPLPALPSAAAPESAGTLIEALNWHVRNHPSRPHILLWRSGEAALPTTYTGQKEAAAC